MDKRKLLLLKYLLNHCNDGYKVIEISKVFGALKKYKGNFEYLEEDILFLKSRKYIDLKYIDSENLCLSILDNTRILQENIRNDSKIKKDYLNMAIITMLFSGIMAFIGAFLAVVLFK